MGFWLREGGTRIRHSSPVPKHRWDINEGCANFICAAQKAFQMYRHYQPFPFAFIHTGSNMRRATRRNGPVPFVRMTLCCKLLSVQCVQDCWYNRICASRLASRPVCVRPYRCILALCIFSVAAGSVAHQEQLVLAGEGRAVRAALSPRLQARRFPGEAVRRPEEGSAPLRGGTYRNTSFTQWNILHYLLLLLHHVVCVCEHPN